MINASWNPGINCDYCLRYNFKVKRHNTDTHVCDILINEILVKGGTSNSVADTVGLMVYEGTQVNINNLKQME